jgi:hypothetical protein
MDWLAGKTAPVCSNLPVQGRLLSEFPLHPSNSLGDRFRQIQLFYHT